MFFFLNLQCLSTNLVLKFRVTQYFRSVIRKIIIENIKSFIKKLSTKKKKLFFTVKKDQWVKWAYTQANPVFID